MPSPTNAPAPPPDQLASAEGELPAEIEDAIDAYGSAEADSFDLSISPRKRSLAATRAAEARAALTTTILSRLTAAESARDGFRDKLSEMRGYLMLAEGSAAKLRTDLSAALARADRLEKALREDAQWHESEANRLDCLPQNDFVRWQSSVHAEQAAKARAALAHPAPAEEEKP